MTAQNLLGQVALITGANTGIGRVTAINLALQGAHVFLACRSEQKTLPVLQEIARLSEGQAKAEFLPLDLADLDSVRACAKQFLERDLPLHILIANAGLAGQKGLTQSGFELAFGVCHVGHFLLVQLLLERLKTSAPARIVIVASRAHHQAKRIDFERLHEPTKSLTGLPEYAVAKLANILFARDLSKRLEGTGVTTYALHPGVVATDVWRAVPWPLVGLLKSFMRTVEQGAETTIYCATAPELADQSGAYYNDCAVAKPSALARDDELAAKLWQASEKWVLA